MGLADIARYQAVVALPWGFKLVAGPFMDRFAYPAMGRRRPWVMGAQGGLTLAMASLVLVPEPLDNLAGLIALAFAVNCFAAVQDVAVDGMAIDVLPVEERGRANAFMGFGQVAGFSSFSIISGTLLSTLGPAAAATSCAVTVGLIFTMITVTRERAGERVLPWTEGRAAPRDGAASTTFLGIMRDLVRVLFLPMSILLTVAETLNRIRDGVALALFPVLGVQHLGYTDAAYAQVTGVMGIVTAVAVVFLGPLIDRFGPRNFLILGFAGSAATSIGFAVAEPLWDSTPFILAMLLVNGLFGQFVFVAFIALSMNICWARVAATQFAIYMSLSNLSRSLGAFLFALVAEDLSYRQDLLVMGGLTLAAAVLLLRFNLASHVRRVESLDAAAPEAEAAISRA